MGVQNPNIVEEIDERTPSDIVSEIEKLNKNKVHFIEGGKSRADSSRLSLRSVSYTHLTLPTNREV